MTGIVFKRHVLDIDLIAACTIKTNCSLRQIGEMLHLFSGARLPAHLLAVDQHAVIDQNRSGHSPYFADTLHGMPYSLGSTISTALLLKVLCAKILRREQWRLHIGRIACSSRYTGGSRLRARGLLGPLHRKSHYIVWVKSLIDFIGS